MTIQTILPEGRLLGRDENLSACQTVRGLTGALARGSILEGTALRFHPDRGLVVSLGPFTGRIPPGEIALENPNGISSPPAFVVRPGLPVSVVVTGLCEEDETIVPLLSRRLAQKRATEHLFSLSPGTVIPATVKRLLPFGAFVDLGCGVSSLVRIERISISRIAHPAHRFTLEQEIFCALWRQEPARSRIHLTHRELLGTWEENAELFSPGTVVPGTIRSIKPYGMFVELTPNFSGLAEHQSDFDEGERVSVYIKSIFPNRMKCKLLIISRLPPAPPIPLRYWLPPCGLLRHWNYAPNSCHKPGSETFFPPE